jgi:hypothetical protein
MHREEELPHPPEGGGGRFDQRQQEALAAQLPPHQQPRGSSSAADDDHPDVVWEMPHSKVVLVRGGAKVSHFRRTTVLTRPGGAVVPPAAKPLTAAPAPTAPVDAAPQRGAAGKGDGERNGGGEMMEDTEVQDPFLRRDTATAGGGAAAAAAGGGRKSSDSSVATSLGLYLPPPSSLGPGEKLARGKRIIADCCDTVLRKSGLHGYTPRAGAYASLSSLTSTGDRMDDDDGVGNAMRSMLRAGHHSLAADSGGMPAPSGGSKVASDPSRPARKRRSSSDSITSPSKNRRTSHRASDTSSASSGASATAAGTVPAAAAAPTAAPATPAASGPPAASAPAAAPVTTAASAQAARPPRQQRPAAAAVKPSSLLSILRLSDPGLDDALALLGLAGDMIMVHTRGLLSKAKSCWRHLPDPFTQAAALDWTPKDGSPAKLLFRDLVYSANNLAKAQDMLEEYLQPGMQLRVPVAVEGAERRVVEVLEAAGDGGGVEVWLNGQPLAWACVEATIDKVSCFQCSGLFANRVPSDRLTIHLSTIPSQPVIRSPGAAGPWPPPSWRPPTKRRSSSCARSCATRTQRTSESPCRG